MTADVELLPCGECGMPCRPGEYHPYAACLMFKTCRNSDTVRGNLQDAQDHATAAKDAEIEALRAEVEMLRDAFSDEDMTAGAHWFGRYVEQKRRAERLAEALRAERRWWVDRKADAIREHVGGLTRGDPGAIARCDAAIQRINAALRDQEGKESFWPKLPGSGGPDWTGHD